MAAVKTAALLSGTEYIADMGLEKLGLTKPRSFASDMQEFVEHGHKCTVIHVLDKVDLDSMLLQYADSEAKRAIALAVLFTVANEVSNLVLNRLNLF